MILRFFGFISITFLIYFGVHFLVFNSLARVFSINNPAFKWTLVVVLPLSFFLSTIGIRIYPNFLTKALYIFSSIWAGVIFLLFSFFLLYEIVHLFTKTDYKNVVIGLLIFVFLLSVYGIINAQSISVKEIKIPLKNLSKPFKIVQLSDIHLGSIKMPGFLEKIVGKVNPLNPDLVLITGDLFDSSASLDNGILEPFEKINSKIYLSMGNHEFYEGIDKVEKILEKSKIKPLENKMEIVDDIQIVGANDPGRGEGEKLEAILKSLNLDGKKPSILMYHQPVDWEIAKDHGTDLQLSGHTHNGQIFPFNLLVKIFYPKIKGLYDLDGIYLYTSPGSGTWGPPMRIGSKNEITVINLVSSA